MVRQWWSSRSDSWQNWFLKRVPEGWVVSLPGPWMLARRRHYLVSEAQRANIIAFFEQDSWRPILAASLLAVALGTLLTWIESAIPFHWSLLLFCLLAGTALNAWLWWRLRPMLVGAQPMAHRIAFGERLRALAAAAPVGSLIFALLVSTVFFAFYAGKAVIASAWDSETLVMAAVFGGMMCWCFALLWTKRKIKAGQSRGG
jgi:hypothetical protein